MTSSRSLLLVRVLAVPFLVTGVVLVLGGAYLAAVDLAERGEMFDGLGAAFDVLGAAAGLPVLVPAVVALVARQARTVSVAGCVLGALAAVVGVLAFDALGAWLALPVGAGVGLVVVSARRLRAGRRDAAC